MGLGGTAKKLQKVMDAAEQLYSRMNEVLQRLTSLEEEFEQTSEQVDHLERNIAEQRALVEALAKEQGLDVEGILDNADLPPVPSDDDGDAGTEGNTESDEEESSSTAVDVTEES